VILGGGVAVCFLLSSHRAVIFAIAQLSCNFIGRACVRASVATPAQRPAGFAVEAALVVRTSVASRAVGPGDCSRPTSTARDTSTLAGTATAPGTNGQLSSL